MPILKETPANPLSQYSKIKLTLDTNLSQISNLKVLLQEIEKTPDLLDRLELKIMITDTTDYMEGTGSQIALPSSYRKRLISNLRPSLGKLNYQILFQSDWTLSVNLEQFLPLIKQYPKYSLNTLLKAYDNISLQIEAEVLLDTPNLAYQQLTQILSDYFSLTTPDFYSYHEIIGPNH
ncbi:hypothetical protein KC853_00660 [Candidatus Saccharibacteria bacterium]|nr:hypothetical protein [Candidatus Saccharibacteria bacterium]MCB9834856.1 hypothetical protein [Candidatus Nomurabacteria bacterium]